MHNIIQKYSRLLLLVAVLSACSKQKGFGPNYKDYNPGDYPVNVQNSVGNRPDPTVTASLSGDSSITIVLTVPASSKHSIKEITKVATSSSYTAIQSTGSTGFYNVPPVPASGATATFKTSIAEYYANNPKSTANPAPKVNTELTFRYFFRITMDDGAIIYPTPVRVLILN